MEKEQTDEKSFFAVGGIHGLPYEPWNDNVKQVNDSEDRWQGYCSHGTVLFPTFHRPYVFLIEQFLQAEAISIAEQYPSELKHEYKEAAQKLRQPFWDWASQSVPPPEVISLEEVEIVTPDGEEASTQSSCCTMPTWIACFLCGSALHPGKWVTPGNSKYGTRTIPPNSIVDINTDLVPFWNSYTTYWTSAGLTQVHNTGYKYPEFKDVGIYDTEALVRTKILEKVNALYGPSELLAMGDGLLDWAIHVQVNQYDDALGGKLVFRPPFKFSARSRTANPEEEDWFCRAELLLTLVQSTAFVNRVLH
ncbi:hypothetical protein CYLTODRAFT_453428 [Cylindrobasidium torrendii FP15055 ss-10]|uniref:Tyrosinase copper-binding domain-containing protein n=1 Tax=Cylindrobasidium torrendii FP15055 ss-10 TaxID=1314674 RepID=A0A0D7BDG3_9AGAR|nr:hypothetical protein CYLTODRAFT_453428 [Cylindrobasidium torrendii FP15055 ss-10]